MWTFLVPSLTLILGFFAVWITIKPPSTRKGRSAWLVLFSLLTVAASLGTIFLAKEDKAEKSRLADLVTVTKGQTDLLYAQNLDLHNQLDQLNQSVRSLHSSAPPAPGSTCLKQQTQALLGTINGFLKERHSKSPAYDPRYANDPHYSEKEQAWEMETSRLYIQQFWPSIQTILQSAVRSAITPEGTTSLATPGYYPEDRWWQAFLKPGYKELTLISQNAPNC